jgi:hypothetical protein
VIPVWFASGRRHDNDFKHIYLGTQALVSREDPYSARSLFLQAHRHGLGDTALNPYVYLPFTGLALSFLAPLPFPVASLVWFVLNHLFCLAAVWLLAGTFYPTRRMMAAGLMLAGLALSHPHLRSLTAGQLNTVLLLGLACACAALCSGRDRLAGAIIGFSAMFKIAPAVFALHLFLTRRWRALPTMLVTCAALLLISIIAFGWDIHLDFVPVSLQMRYGHSTWQEHGATFWKDPWNQSPNSFLTHVMVDKNRVSEPWIRSSQKLANAATTVFALLMIGLYVATVLCAMRGARDSSVRRELIAEGCTTPPVVMGAFCATIPLMLLLPSLMWDHYLMLLIIPAAWLVRTFMHTRRWALLGLVVVCYVATCIPVRFDSPHFRNGVGVAMMSAKLFPTLVLALLALFATLELAIARPPHDTCHS